MHPTEAILISAYARGVMGDVILMAVGTVFYGIPLRSPHSALALIADTGVYVLIFPLAAIVLCRRKRNTVTFVMFALTIVVFLLTTTDWVAQLYILVDLLQVGFLDLPGSDVMRQFQKAQADMQWIFVLGNWPMNVNISVNDAILVWRVCCLFPHNIWIRVSVCILGITSGGLALTIATWGSVDVLRGNEGNTLSGTERMEPLTTAWITISIFTNMVCIGLIGRIAWKHRTMLLGSTRTSSVQKILSLLIESGVVLVALQVTFLITQSIERPLLSPEDIATNSIVRAATISAAIVPSLVLVVVSQEDSLSQGDGRPGPLDDEISAWKVAKNTFSSQNVLSRRNSETSIIQTDTITPHWRFGTGGEV